LKINVDMYLRCIGTHVKQQLRHIERNDIMDDILW
jgi:hypothetical protein